MKKIFILILALAGLCLGSSSCNKEEGEGGTAIIQGKVMLILHDNDNYNLTTDTIVAAKTDVFIIYGNNDIYGDDMKTSANGQYKFKYLKKGTYTIFAYSILPSGEKIAVSKTVEVKKGETLTVPTIYIHDGKAYGTSMVRGQVEAMFFHKSEFIQSGWAYEHRVYIRRLNEPYHFDDVRVGIDGWFYFQQLTLGTYEVFTVTEDLNEIPSLVRDTVTVTSPETIFDTDKFTIIINV